MQTYEFSDCDHAQGYLAGSIIRGRGRPVIVEDVFDADDGELWAIVCSPKQQDNDEFRLEDLDLSAPPIGMMTVRDMSGNSLQALYLYRKPQRMWKAGIVYDNIRYSPVDETPASISVGLSHDEWYCSESFWDSLYRRYPSYLDAYNEMKDAVLRSVAISPSFAISGRGGLYYTWRESPVGKATEYGPVLDEEFECLTDILNEELRL
jgi:hypothetical protein